MNLDFFSNYLQKMIQICSLNEHIDLSQKSIVEIEYIGFISTKYLTTPKTYNIYLYKNQEFCKQFNLFKFQLIK